METLINIVELYKKYRINCGDVVALKKVSLLLPEQGLIFIMGSNGSGKTTLLNMLSMMDKPTSGCVYYGNTNIVEKKRGYLERYRRQIIGYSNAEHRLLTELNVYENIELPCLVSGDSNKEDRKVLVMNAMEQLGIVELALRKINELSSGQRQKVALARAIVKKPKILLCDEPFVNVDEPSSEGILKCLKTIAQERLVILVSHNRLHATKYADRIIELKEGSIISDSNPMNHLEHQSNVPPVKKEKTALFSLLKYYAIFLKKQWMLLMITTALLGITLTLFGNFYALANYDSQKALALTLDSKNDNVIGVAEYVHTARYVNGVMLHHGAFPFIRHPISEMVLRLEDVVDGRAQVTTSHYFRKNLQDFIDYRVIFDTTYVHTPFISTHFTDIIVVDDFSSFTRRLRYGALPEEENDILIFDYMAYNILRTEALAIDRMSDLVGIVLTDKDTGLTMKIAGIIKTDYESYAYAIDKNNYEYPFESIHLSRFQSIIASSEFLINLEKEREYFSINEILFTGDNVVNGGLEDNTYRKMRMVTDLSKYDFIGSIGSWNSGILLSKHQLAHIVGIDVAQIDANFVSSTNIQLFFRYMLYGDGTIFTKGGGLNRGVGVVGVYESEEFDPFVIDCIYGYSNDDLYLNGDFRQLYVILGNNPVVNHSLLQDLRWPSASDEFFLDNPDYEAYGFAKIPAYSISINQADGYVSSLRPYGKNLAMVSLCLLAASMIFYIIRHYKRNTYNIFVLSMQGAHRSQINAIIALQLITCTCIGFLLSIYPIQLRVEALNRDLSSNIPGDITFFSMSYLDYIKMFGIAIVLSLLGVMLSTLFQKRCVPIKKEN